jgi:multidrug efflux pump subunit AcrA (membrane-fusion protein)
MKMSKRTTVRTSLGRLALVVLLSAAASCGRSEGEGRVAAARGSAVQVTHPRIQDFTEFVDLNANTVFLQKEIVRATFQGFIERIYKNVGDEVARGDLVLTVKTKESAADDSILIKLGTEMFQGSVELRAHSDGVLTALNYHSGDFVSEGEEIAVIANPSSLRISLNVPFAYVGRIAPETVCEIFLPDERKVPAVIQKIIPSVDPASQTQTFLLRPERPVALPENLNVNARLPLRTAKDAVVLPRSAVMSNETQDTFWVMRMADDTTAVRVDVVKGIESDSLIQVVEPALAASDRIVSDGAYGLPDTARVTVVNGR